MFPPESENNPNNDVTFSAQAFSIETLVSGYWIREMKVNYHSNGSTSQTVQRLIVAKDKDDLFNKLGTIIDSPVSLSNADKMKNTKNSIRPIGFCQEEKTI